MESDWIIERLEPRKRFLDFIEELYGETLMDEIGKNLEIWIEELSTIMPMVTQHNITARVGGWEPPKNEPEFRTIGENVFYYDGNDIRSQGLWTSRETNDYSRDAVPGQTKIEWTRYKLDRFAELKINSTYENIDSSQLLPENIETNGILIKDDKRPIVKAINT